MYAFFLILTALLSSGIGAVFSASFTSRFIRRKIAASRIPVGRRCSCAHLSNMHGSRGSCDLCRCQRYDGEMTMVELQLWGDSETRRALTSTPDRRTYG